MAYESQCGGCVEYDFQGDNVKGYCSWYRSYYYPGDSCSHQRPREQSSGSFCYITTIICDVLGYDDNCNVLNSLRSLRDNVMQKSCMYLPLLLEYDVIGPKIANLIKEEYDKTKDKEMWIQFYNFYLVPTANFVEEKKNSEAIVRYIEMIAALKEYFTIEDLDLSEMAKNYDMSQGGHGRVKFLEKKGEI